MKKISLNGSWNGKCLAKEGEESFSFAGTVPGCVHTDLMGSRIDRNLYFRDNADACLWIESRDWEYSRSFVLEGPCADARLVFEGLDVYCKVFLNGVELGDCDDMHIAYSFAVGHLLRPGENTVSVRFFSPVAAVAGKEPRPGAFTTERLHTRRIQCTYGWDWVARFVTCGIYRDVYLEIPSDLSVKSLYVYTESVARNVAEMVVEAEFERFLPGGLVPVEILSPDGEQVFYHEYYVREACLREYIDIEAPRLWYPAGYGDQPLYTLRVGDRTERFGIRTVRVLQLPDRPGDAYDVKCREIKNTPSGEEYDANERFSGFLLTVNDVKIMCKGANWVPSEPFPSAESDGRITYLLSLARQMNLNMLRVWGGGIFEKQHFYSECDRLGILVTQDFLMACGSYPEEDPYFLSQLRRETEYAALALRNHPCLVWWSGDNENAIRGADDMEQYQGRTAIHEGIAPVLRRLDPKRRLFASSPYGGKLFASKTVGTTHNTQYLNYIFDYIEQTDMADYKAYFSTYAARFIAEEPTMGAACLPSLRKFMNDKDIFEEKEMWLYHTKGNPAMKTSLFDYTVWFSEKVLGKFKDGADRLFKLKYVQYEWVRVSFETVRRNTGFCNGVVYWMFDDCWPAAVGWSFVDYYCLPKASYYSFKRCAGSLIASIDKQQDEYQIYLCSDIPRDVPVQVRLYGLTGGKPVLLAETETVAPGQTASVVQTVPAVTGKQASVLICDIAYEGGQDRAFYKNGPLSLVPTDAVRVTERTENSLTVTADRYVHAVELEGEYIFSDNYFSLLPDEKRTVTYSPAEKAADEGFAIRGYTLADSNA